MCKFLPPLLTILVAWTATAEAGLFRVGGASKCCDCVPDFQPPHCRPKIIRPRCYHPNPPARCCKPQGCDMACPTTGCGPVIGSCVSGCCYEGAPCELVRLMQIAQLDCDPRERRTAIHLLSDRFDCSCHPQVMQILVLALSDTDHRVRSKAADEIGDQLRENPCCCTSSVVCALKYALGDCDRFVRRQAEEALRVAGYDVVDGCPDACDGSNGCCPPGCDIASVPTAPAVPATAASESTAIEPASMEKISEAIVNSGSVPPPEALQPDLLPGLTSSLQQTDAPIPTIQIGHADPAGSETASIEESSRKTNIREGLGRIFRRRK